MGDVIEVKRFKCTGKFKKLEGSAKFARDYEIDIDVNMESASAFRGGLRSFLLRKAIPDALAKKEPNFCGVSTFYFECLDGEVDEAPEKEDEKTKAKESKESEAPKKGKKKSGPVDTFAESPE